MRLVATPPTHQRHSDMLAFSPSLLRTASRALLARAPAALAASGGGGARGANLRQERRGGRAHEGPAFQRLSQRW
jgi:hypothetical protein